MDCVLVVKGINNVILQEADGPQYVDQSKNQIFVDLRGRTESATEDRKSKPSGTRTILFL